MSNFFFLFANETADINSARVTAVNINIARETFIAYVENAGWKVEVCNIAGVAADCPADLVIG